MIKYTIRKNGKRIKWGSADSRGEATELFDEIVFADPPIDRNGNARFVSGAEAMGAYIDKPDGSVVLTKGDFEIEMS